MSLNRWVFKWAVAFESENVLAQSNVSRYREFQVDGAATLTPHSCDSIDNTDEETRRASKQEHNSSLS